MFDIGFWEIALIVVVALLVVGPEEFPSLIRNASQWLGKMRRFMSDVKSDLDKELTKAEELKKLLDKEALIAKLHENVDVSSPAVPIKSAPEAAPNASPVASSAVSPDETLKSDQAKTSDSHGASNKVTASPSTKPSHDTQN